MNRKRKQLSNDLSKSHDQGLRSLEGLPRRTMCRIRAKVWLPDRRRIGNECGHWMPVKTASVAEQEHTQQSVSTTGCGTGSTTALVAVLLLLHPFGDVVSRCCYGAAGDLQLQECTKRAVLIFFFLLQLPALPFHRLPLLSLTRTKIRQFLTDAIADDDYVYGEP